MEELNTERIHYSKKIRLQLRNLLFVLIGAILFSFLMGVLANILVNHYMLSIAFTSESIYLIIIVITALIIISYCLYYWYVFAPYSRITREIVVPIIYNIKDGFVIGDPFDGYYPQQMAWQAFERFREKYPGEAKNRINKGIPPRTTKKHILTELLEYLIILELSKDLYGFDKKGLMSDKTIAELPDGLEKNTFISFFKTLKPKDIVDRGMSQLEFNLPEDIAIKYWSPAPIKGSLSDSNTFKIGFIGKYCESYLTGEFTSDGPIPSMTCGPAPIFEGVYIHRYFQKELEKNLDKLWRSTFHLTIEARFKLRAYLRPPFEYIQWAERWIEGFVKGTFFGGFDFEEFRKEKIHSIEYDLYETIKMIDARLEEIENEMST